MSSLKQQAQEISDYFYDRITGIFDENSRKTARQNESSWPGKTDVINVRFSTEYNICNYSCPYCIAGQNNKANIIEKWDSTNYETIIENLTKLPFNINVRLGVGGEFFLNKKLISGARTLSHAENVHSVNLITNLSFSIKHYKKIFNDFNQQKVAVVASYHPTDVKDHDKWIETAAYMQENFDFAVIMVAYPPSLYLLPKLRQELINNGHMVFVQSFIGNYEGKKYPYAYTQEEKDLIRSISFSRHDYEFFVEAIKPNLCNSGYKSFYVNMSGNVIPCGMGIKYESLGNLAKSPEIKLNNKPQICRARTCMCDTENVNTVVFEKFYKRDGKNQHIYQYRHTEEATQNPELDEWKVDYTDRDNNH